MPAPRPPDIPIWLRGRFASLREGPTSAVVRRDFLPTFRRLGLMDAAREPRLVGAPSATTAAPGAPAPGGAVEPGAATDLAPAAGPSGAPGRGRTALLPAGSLGEAVLRPYRRGGWVRRVNRRRYFLGDRAFHELALTERLGREGVPVPEVLAAVQTSRRPGYVAALVTLRVPEAPPASSVLRGLDPEAAGPVLTRIGRSVARLHRAGGWHADLNAHNILVPRDPAREPILLDFDRGRLLPFPLPALLARRNTRRLRRSLRKLDLRGAAAAWTAFESGYRKEGEGRPHEGGSGDGAPAGR